MKHAKLNIQRSSVRDLEDHRASVLRHAEEIETELAKREATPRLVLSSKRPGCVLELRRTKVDAA